MIRFLTAGESHGKGVTLILEGIPANMDVDFDLIANDLKRRKTGYGRGGRMKIESDAFDITGGIRNGKTFGAPISLFIENLDYPNHQKIMSVEKGDPELERITIPRPGHADLAGSQKYRFDDIRNVIERSSARETVMRTAAGSFAKMLLAHASVSIGSFVESIGGIYPSDDFYKELCGQTSDYTGFKELQRRAEGSSLRVLEEKQEADIIQAIDIAANEGDTLGGSVVTFAEGLPAGLGSYVQYDRRFDAAIAAAIMSINGIKGVEIGLAGTNAEERGSRSNDPIYKKGKGFGRRSNRAGGIEGGMTTGMPLLLRSFMKPIPTTRLPLESVNLADGIAAKSRYERSDVTAVPACSVITEAMTALTIASFFMQKFGGDSIDEMVEHYSASKNAEDNFFHT